MNVLLAPPMIFMSGAFMAVAWLGHLRIREMSFWIALAMSLAIVLPEYVLNVTATRYGYGAYTGAQMAAFHLASGVVCVTLVSPLHPRREDFLVADYWFRLSRVGNGPYPSPTNRPLGLSQPLRSFNTGLLEPLRSSDLTR